MKPSRLTPLVLLTLTGCASCQPEIDLTSNDEIHLTSVAGSDSATLVLKGRRAGCFKDEMAQGWPKVLVRNLLSTGRCRSEVCAFAKNNAMTLKTVSEWSDAPGDVVPVAMQARYVVPLNIFIMSGDVVSHSPVVRQNEARMNVLRASQFYDDNQCGIEFSIGVLKDATSGNFDWELLREGCTENVEKFKAVDEQTASKGVNVFYTDGSSDTLGEMCRDGTSAVIVISKYSDNEVLAHELGHALSLEHTNSVPGMPLADLMRISPSSPDTLTIGQCYRMNVDSMSVLNTLVRTDQTRFSESSTPDWEPRSCARPTNNCLPLTLQK